MTTSAVAVESCSVYRLGGLSLVWDRFFVNVVRFDGCMVSHLWREVVPSPVCLRKYKDIITERLLVIEMHGF